MLSPVVTAVLSALIGTGIWYALETAATSWGAGSDTRTTDAVFVALLLLQTGFYVAVRPHLRKAGKQCVEELRPILSVSDEVLDTLQNRFDGVRWMHLAPAMVIGALIAIVMQEAQMQRFSHWFAEPDLALGEMWVVLAAWSTWTFGLAAAMMVISDANLIRRMGREWITIDLMRIDGLTAFSRYGLNLASAVIGVMALWGVSLVLINAVIGFDWARASGFVGVIMVVMYIALAIAVFIFPQLGVRDHIRDNKDAVYRELTSMLPASAQTVSEANENPVRLAALLSSRTQIQAIPEWPAGQHTHVRLAAYLLVPLLSWSAAALVEEVLSRTLW